MGSVQADGYHPVSSWMVFADLGDRLSLARSPAWLFEVGGDTAPGIGDGENLAERAARLLLAAAGLSAPALRLHLDKRLPVAAGLGGGSSDAGAALRLLNPRLPRPLAPAALEAVAAELGADGPACLRARSVLATGVGEVLAAAPECPPLPAVLVNPRRPSPTGAVYRAYDSGRVADASPPGLPPRFDSVEAVAQALLSCRNDLQAPALALEPSIGEVLELLAGAPQSLLARMSGSGATCFALCADTASALVLARMVEVARPDWWVRPCRLGSLPNGAITNS